jgi:hypothetical protein
VQNFDWDEHPNNSKVHQMHAHYNSASVINLIHTYANSYAIFHEQLWRNLHKRYNILPLWKKLKTGNWKQNALIKIEYDWIADNKVNPVPPQYPFFFYVYKFNITYAQT